MTDTANNVAPRTNPVDDLAYSPLILFPVIGMYFESKAHEIVNKNIKELIEEEKRSHRINCVPQMQNLIDIKRGFYNISSLRDLICAALVVEAFVIGFFPFAFSAYFIGIFCISALLSHHRVQDCDAANWRLRRSNTIPDGLLINLGIK